MHLEMFHSRIKALSHRKERPVPSAPESTPHTPVSSHLGQLLGAGETSRGALETVGLSLYIQDHFPRSFTSPGRESARSPPEQDYSDVCSGLGAFAFLGGF